MKARAFCPGHVTGFFEVQRNDDLLAYGSRGAGMCISLGATSEVALTPATKQTVRVTVNGRSSRAETTRAAIGHLIGDTGLKVQVSTELDLPVSQGFGMSAAGALSAAIAACYLLGRDRQEAYEAAHIAEVKTGCGLGDVPAIHRGGITLRRRPGLPPRGEVLNIEGAPEVVLAVVGKKLVTRTILEDESAMDSINAQGKVLVSRMLKEPTVERMMYNSREFAVRTGLARRRIVKIMDEANRQGMTSMAMLGNSIFGIGDVEGLASLLEGYGNVYRCRVDTQGPRLLNDFSTHTA